MGVRMVKSAAMTGAELRQIRFVRPPREQPLGKIRRQGIGAQHDFPAVHPHAAEVAHRRAARRGVQPEHHDGAARLVFPQEAARLAADDHDRLLVAVRLHMDAGAVADIAADEDAAAPHRVAGRVARHAVDADFAVVHRVADGVLRVAVYEQAAAVQIGAQRVAGNAADVDGFPGQAAGDIPLPAAVLDDNLRIGRLADLPVERLEMHAVCVNHHKAVILPVQSVFSGSARAPRHAMPAGKPSSAAAGTGGGGPGRRAGCGCG